MNFDCSLYLVTDSTGLDERDFLRRVEEACAAGVTLVQLREKERDGREYLNLAMKVKEITDKYNIPLIIDDRIDIAMSIDAAGVHVGQSDINVRYARKLLGENKIVGATTKTIEQAKEAVSEGADYLGVGAIYPTTTKVTTVITEVSTLNKIVGATTKTIEQAKEAVSEGADYLGVGAIYPTTTKVTTVITEVSTLSNICEVVDIPVVAIGGLNENNCDVLIGSKISGIAVVSAIMKAKDIKEATKRLKEKVNSIKIGKMY